MLRENPILEVCSEGSGRYEFHTIMQLDFPANTNSIELNIVGQVNGGSQGSWCSFGTLTNTSFVGILATDLA